MGRLHAGGLSPYTRDVMRRPGIVLVDFFHEMLASDAA